jgi:hypothetical protein
VLQKSIFAFGCLPMCFLLDDFLNQDPCVLQAQIHVTGGGEPLNK